MAESGNWAAWLCARRVWPKEQILKLQAFATFSTEYWKPAEGDDEFKGLFSGPLPPTWPVTEKARIRVFEILVQKLEKWLGDHDAQTALDHLRPQSGRSEFDNEERRKLCEKLTTSSTEDEIRNVLAEVKKNLPPRPPPGDTAEEPKAKAKPSKSKNEDGRQTKGQGATKGTLNLQKFLNPEKRKEGIGKELEERLDKLEEAVAETAAVARRNTALLEAILTSAGLDPNEVE